MIVAATLLCDRKATSQLVAIPAMFHIRGVNTIYINIQTDSKTKYKRLYHFLERQSSAYVVERWNRRGWGSFEPSYDQDQKRLFGIVPARNMAIDFALAKNAEWLLFIDADVVPKSDGLETLLALNKPLCGGLVPGRAANDVGRYYVFGGDIGIEEHADYYRCGHGTCGYMLIHRTIFSRLRFRWGQHMQKIGEWYSEDPLFCSDAMILGLCDGFYISKHATADHWDDPQRPLTPEDYHRDIRESLVEALT